MSNSVIRFLRCSPLHGTLLVALLYAASAVHAETSPLHCMVKGVDPGDVLNIRLTPDHRSEKVGTIPADAQSVIKLGPVQAVGGGEWFKISYQTTPGWVNAKFLRCRLSPAQAEKAVADRAKDIITALKNRDMERFSDFVHPLKGVRFSPYAYVEPDRDRVFSAAEVRALFSDDTKKQWGYYDGSGEPIDTTFANYFRRFIYTHDFSNSENIGYNNVLKTGNTTDNSWEIYPDAVIVDYHVAASDPAKLDWGSLRLALEEFNNDWYIVGLIHDEWTI